MKFSLLLTYMYISVDLSLDLKKNSSNTQELITADKNAGLLFTSVTC